MILLPNEANRQHDEECITPQPKPRPLAAKSNLLQQKIKSSVDSFLPPETVRPGAQHEKVTTLRKFNWGNTEEQFEEKCKQHLQNEYGVPPFHASFVAKTVGTGATKTAARQQRKKNVGASYSLYASMFDKLLSSPPPENDLAVDTTENAGGSLQAQLESLKQKSQRQEEELEFLRSTLRMLVLPSSQDEDEDGGSAEYDDFTEEYESDYDDFDSILWELEIPEEIEFPEQQGADGNDDISGPI